MIIIIKAVVVIIIINNSLYQLLFTTMKDFKQPGQTQQTHEVSQQKPQINSILI